MTPMTRDIQQRAADLAERQWDLPAIQARFRHLVEHGIPRKRPEPETLTREKDTFLDQVQLRAEQYCYLTRNCAKGSALALLEAFGLGNMDIVRAMSPFPGLAMSDGICGPVAGGLTAIGLLFSDEDPADFENVAHYVVARRFLRKFQAVFGSLACPDIQKQLLGRAYDPFSSSEERQAYHRSGAREKCPVAPGLGARLAAEIMIAGLEKSV